MPVVGPLSYKLKPRRGISFVSSAIYWERRYQDGGNSGAGSYNRLAEFKAEVLNEFVEENGVRSVLELGCGDGAQLELAQYPRYVGVDISQTVVESTRKRFADRPHFTFLHSSDFTRDLSADLVISLDVIYHLVEDEVFESYMRQLFDAARKAVVIYASNKDEPSLDAHVRHRSFSDWVCVNRPDFRLTDHIPNPYPFDPRDPDQTSFADFYVYRRENC